MVVVKRAMLLASGLMLVAAACGGDSSEDTSSGTPSDGATTTSGEVDTTTTTQAPASSGGIQVAAGWTMRPVGNGIKPVLALDQDDLPAIAWLVEVLPEGFVSFASAADGWTEDRFVEGYFYGPIGLDFDPNGDPHIVYHDHQGNTFQDELGDLTYAVRDGAAWTIEAAADDGHDGWDSTITVGLDGIVRAAGIDPQQFGREDGVEYYELGTDGWQVTAIGSGPVEYEWNVDLGVSPSGRVGLSYHDNNTRDLIYAEQVDGDWQLETVESDGDVGKFSSLAFDAAGNPHISYYAVETGTVRYAVRGEGGWTSEEVGTLSDVAISFTGARRITAIDIDSGGKPHIVFADQGVVRYASRTDSGWEASDVLTAGARPFGQLVTFELDGSDTPHIATYEGTADEAEDAEIIYLTRP